MFERFCSIIDKVFVCPNIAMYVGSHLKLPLGYEGSNLKRTLVASSVTRCWRYKVTQILPKVAQILATAVLHQLIFYKTAQTFGLLL